MVIPSGKKVRLRRREESVVGVPMILAEPLTINLSSSFEPLFSGSSNLQKNANVVGGLIRDFTAGEFGFSGQMEQMGYQIWSKSDPLAINITVTFHVDKTNVNAFQQVYLPTIALSMLPLPARQIGGILSPPGPSVAALLGEEGQDTTGLDGLSQYPDYVRRAASGGKLSLEIGRVLRVPSVIVLKAEPTWAIETDEDGYPIWSKVALDIQSVMAATTQLVGGEA